MNYPPGMTREDWKHIDGDQHYSECMMHEDFEHKCQRVMSCRVQPEGDMRWVLLHRMFPHVGIVQIDFCPYCGDELPPIRCICEEIAEEQKALIAEQKTAT